MSEIKGKVLKVLPEQVGTGKKGPWIKQEFVIETPGDYPKKVCFVTFGETLNKILSELYTNQEVIVSYNLESREYNERWYTEARAWKIEAEKKTPISKEQKELVGKVVDKFDLVKNDDEDSLPF